MKNNKSAKLNRLLMLIMVFMMLLVLSGCRTRISNNTEVASTITDEDGWLTELYQERRDDLEMPVAKKPFITGTNQDEEYSGEGYDRDMEELDDYADDPWEDEEDVFGEEEDEETSSSSTSTSSSTTSSTTTRRPSSTTVRRRTTTSTTRRKTTTTTKKKTSTDSSKKNTQQTETPETPKKQFTVSFDGSGVDVAFDPITVEEGSTYHDLPKPSSDEYTFGGWFTKEGGKGTRVEDGDAFTGNGDQTLYAYWIRKDAKEIWTNRFEVAANKITDDKKINCYVVSDTVTESKAKDFADECKAKAVVAPDSAEEPPACLIVFRNNDEIVENVAKDAYTKYHDGSAEDGIAAIPTLTKVIVISTDSITGTGNAKSKLLYKMQLLSELYGSFTPDDIANAMTELELEPSVIDIYQQP